MYITAVETPAGWELTSLLENGPSRVTSKRVGEPPVVRRDTLETRVEAGDCARSRGGRSARERCCRRPGPGVDAWRSTSATPLLRVELAHTGRSAVDRRLESIERWDSRSTTDDVGVVLEAGLEEGPGHHESRPDDGVGYQGGRGVERDGTAERRFRSGERSRTVTPGRPRDTDGTSSVPARRLTSRTRETPAVRTDSRRSSRTDAAGRRSAFERRRAAHSSCRR